MYWYSLRTKLGSKEALDSELLGIKDKDKVKDKDKDAVRINVKKIR